MDTTRTQARALRNDATDAERQMWRYLQGRRLDALRFRRQVPIAGYIVDFVCPALKLVIELDGGQHADRVDYDVRRTAVLEAKGYRVLRYWNDDVLLRVEAVLDDVLRVSGDMRESNSNGSCHSNSNSNSTPPQPSPSLRERAGAKSEALLDFCSRVAAADIRKPQDDQELLPPFRAAKGRVGEGSALDLARHAEFDPVGVGVGVGVGVEAEAEAETETQTEAGTNSRHRRETTP